MEFKLTVASSRNDRYRGGNRWPCMWMCAHIYVRVYAYLYIITYASLSMHMRNEIIWERAQCYDLSNIAKTILVPERWKIL